MKKLKKNDIIVLTNSTNIRADSGAITVGSYTTYPIKFIVTSVDDMEYVKIQIQDASNLSQDKYNRLKSHFNVDSLEGMDLPRNYGSHRFAPFSELEFSRFKNFKSGDICVVKPECYDVPSRYTYLSSENRKPLAKIISVREATFDNIATYVDIVFETGDIYTVSTSDLMTYTECKVCDKEFRQLDGKSFRFSDGNALIEKGSALIYENGYVTNGTIFLDFKKFKKQLTEIK